MNEEELSDALKGGVPPRPDTAGWADEARRRSRRRRAWTPGALIAVLIAIAAAVASGLPDQPVEIVATPAPSGPAPKVDCRLAVPPSGDVDLSTLTRAVGCTDDAVAVELDAGLTVDVLASVRDGAFPMDTAAPAPEPPDLILLADDGSRLSLVREDDAIYWWDDGSVQHVWDPGAELDARIQEALGLAPGPVRPSPIETGRLPDARGDGLVPTVCDEVQSGEIPVPDLPADEDLPTGAARVWLCGDMWERFGGVGPIEPLTTDADRAVEALNTLPPSEADVCTEMLGLTYHVVVDYPDGSRRVVAAETANCQFVGGWGGREGGAELLDQLLGLWSAQRGDSPEPFTAGVDVCGDLASAPTGTMGLNSIADVERASLYRGFVCGVPEGAAPDADMEQRDLPGELVIAITQATATPVDQWAYPDGSPVVVMLNQYGDPVTYPVDDQGRLQLDDGVWTPEGDLADPWAETLDGLWAGR